ncbi:hypothetical protein EXIGLDRAFT_829389 [Exidia glandulosa HHB12029]|uniref:Secreted protein n=1 Tax=Exidia glandulosa HHB12029 TaxID=1314781 RepID=A0A165PGZ4_EXIGL|nr:hypothetical protein EXIGLDRAFT_829389 [Exidia glandulosa HHB12029]
MLPVAIAAFVAVGPLAALAVPAFKTRMNALSTSYDESYTHVYVVHREMRHSGGLSSAMPMPMAHPHPPSQRDAAVFQESADVSSRSILTGASLLNSKLDQLCSYRDGMDASSSAIHGLAAVSTTQAALEPLFASQCTNELLSLQSSLEAYQDLLGNLCLETMLASLGGRLGDIEATLGNVASSANGVMLDIGVIVENVPSLKAQVGPIVYGIKCALDDLLDNITTDMAGGLLAELHINLGLFQPQLNAVVRAATRTACGCAVPALASVCV